MPKARSAQPRQAPATRTDGGGGGDKREKGDSSRKPGCSQGPKPPQAPPPQAFPTPDRQEGDPPSLLLSCLFPICPLHPRGGHTGCWGYPRSAHGANGAMGCCSHRSRRRCRGEGASEEPVRGWGGWSWGFVAQETCPRGGCVGEKLGPAWSGEGGTGGRVPPRTHRCRQMYTVSHCPPDGRDSPSSYRPGPSTARGSAAPLGGGGCTAPPPPGPGLWQTKDHPPPPSAAPGPPSAGGSGGGPGRAAAEVEPRTKGRAPAGHGRDPPPTKEPRQGPREGAAATLRSPARSGAPPPPPSAPARPRPRPPGLLPPPALPAPTRGGMGPGRGKGGGSLCAVPSPVRGGRPRAQPRCRGGGGMGTLADPPSPSPTSLCAAEPAAPWAP